MSTQVIETNLEMMRQDLVQFINDEPLDMLDEFTDEEIADTCISVAKFLGHTRNYIGSLKDYKLKIENRLKGFVSLSNDYETGVSHTEYYPFFLDDPEDGAFTGLCCLAQMLNEAWYYLNN